MSISNCSAAGADSRANPVTGVVTRRDPVTHAEVPATVRPNGIPVEPVQKVEPIKSSTLSSSTLAAVLSFEP